MAILSTDKIAALLQPFVPAQTSGKESHEESLPPKLLDQLSLYLDLLLRWNARISLTSIRSPEEIVQRHFGESLFAGFYLGRRLPADPHLLDYGSGAGFPGLPIQLLLPHARVTLAESQAKKATFLREVVRELSLPTEIWPKRVEEMPSERSFDAVTLRAVDRMEISLQEAETRVHPGGWLLIMGGKDPEAPAEAEKYALPNSEYRRLILRQKH